MPDNENFMVTRLLARKTRAGDREQLNGEEHRFYGMGPAKNSPRGILCDVMAISAWRLWFLLISAAVVLAAMYISATK